ncbi:hypothetical protein D0Z07_8955 [Hyphodiscus hymeniophilus]|uniref:Prolyl 4-hydroxylase alpha subunit domain-containing protein n=1 Tax=Hyphodiscus hymeniophilus TaxID=353542 RepID=A0A9P6VDP4_9HELO|nr:hypothetical protein D0Z07_8955 [Hyphodiscus hymeniophilus]
MSETPQPTLTNLSLSHPSLTPPPSHFVHQIHNLLSTQECLSLILSHKNLIASNVTPTTIRTREAFTDYALATLLWSRLPFYHDTKILDEANHSWFAVGLNERFRLCRYEKGGKFSPHMDGRFMRTVDEQSWMAVNIYLNTVPLHCGGATRILLELGEGREEVLGSVQPTMGMASVFRDNLWHDGAELLSGEKYLLRTDIMYRREVPFNFESLCSEFDDEGSGRKAMALAVALEDSGNYEEAMKWYKKAFRLAPELERNS